MLGRMFFLAVVGLSLVACGTYTDDVQRPGYASSLAGIYDGPPGSVGAVHMQRIDRAGS